MRIITLLVMLSAMYCVEVIRIELLDVHGLWGGRNVVVRRDNKLFVSIVGRNAGEYDGNINYEQFLKTINMDALMSYKEVERPGVPDEAKPVINIYLNTGERLSYSKWVNDKNPAFDDAYNLIRALEKHGDLKQVQVKRRNIFDLRG